MKVTSPLLVMFVTLVSICTLVATQQCSSVPLEVLYYRWTFNNFIARSEENIKDFDFPVDPIQDSHKIIKCHLTLHPHGLKESSNSVAISFLFQSQDIRKEDLEIKFHILNNYYESSKGKFLRTYTMDNIKNWQKDRFVTDNFLPLSNITHYLTTTGALDLVLEIKRFRSSSTPNSLSQSSTKPLNISGSHCTTSFVGDQIKNHFIWNITLPVDYIEAGANLKYPIPGSRAGFVTLTERFAEAEAEREIIFCVIIPEEEEVPVYGYVEVLPQVPDYQPLNFSVRVKSRMCYNRRYPCFPNVFGEIFVTPEGVFQLSIELYYLKKENQCNKLTSSDLYNLQRLSFLSEFKFEDGTMLENVLNLQNHIKQKNEQICRLSQRIEELEGQCIKGNNVSTIRFPIAVPPSWNIALKPDVNSFWVMWMNVSKILSGSYHADGDVLFNNNKMISLSSTTPEVFTVAKAEMVAEGLLELSASANWTSIKTPIENFLSPFLKPKEYAETHQKSQGYKNRKT